MKLSTRYQVLSTPPENLVEYLIKIQTLYIQMTNRQGISATEAREQADYACESPAIMPMGSHTQDHYYTATGWKRKLVILPKMSVAVRDGV